MSQHYKRRQESEDIRGRRNNRESIEDRSRRNRAESREGSGSRRNRSRSRAPFIRTTQYRSLVTSMERTRNRHDETHIDGDSRLIY